MELRPSQRYKISQEKMAFVAGKKRIGPIICLECGNETDSPCKGMCRTCYSRLKAQERAEKRNFYSPF